MKRPLITLIILVLVCALVFASYLVIDKAVKNSNDEPINDGESADKSSVILTLDTFDTEKIMTNITGDVLTFYKEGDCFYSSSLEGVPLTEALVQTMASAISTVKSTLTVAENCKDMSEFGFDNGKYVKITIDGVTTTLKFGTLEAVRYNAYYFTFDDTCDVFLVSTDYYNAFDKVAGDLIENDTLPTYETILSVSVSGFGKTKEYLPTNEDGVFDAVKAVKLTDVLGYYPRASEFGFDSPITVKVSFESTISATVDDYGSTVGAKKTDTATLVIGCAENDGSTSYYMRVKPGEADGLSDYIYTFDTENFDKIIEGIKE